MTFMPRQPDPRSRRLNPSGFTLAELMFVVGLIILLMGIAVPGLQLMRSTSRTESGVNSINIAVTAARAYAFNTAQKQARFVDLINDPYYRGAAAIFTPTDEVRIVENIAPALSGSGVRLKQMTPPHNGYADIYNRDYIKLPSGIGVVGISRNALGTVLLAPPFALRFNERGILTVGEEPHTPNIVYYDGNVDGRYSTTSYRGTSGWTPSTLDPEFGGASNIVETSSGFKAALPIEGIEAVAGVIVFSKAELRSANLALTTTMQTGIDPVAQWIEANGKAMFFSRYSGVWMRER